MGIGVKLACPCFGSFVLQVGPRIAPPKYCLFPFICTKCEAASCLDIHAELLACAHCGSASVIASPRSVDWGQRQCSHAGRATNSLPTS